MQDRFKFRVFSTTNNKYTDIEVSTALAANSVSNNQFVIQQCLGVKDKNNRLLYEGDIVKYSPIYEEVIIPSISEVIYSNGCYLTKNIRLGKSKRYSADHIKWFKEKHDEDVSNEIDLYSPTDEYGTDWTNVEVIGSIANTTLVDLEGNIISTLTNTEDMLKQLGV